MSEQPRDEFMQSQIEAMKAGEVIRIPALATEPPLVSLGKYAEEYMAAARRNGIESVKFQVGQYEVTVSPSK